MTTADELLERWCQPNGSTAPRVLVFSPHPDDDVLGLGGQLTPFARALHVAYVSDGAPENPDFYRPLGFRERGDYAEARRVEARRALALAGIDASAVHELGAIDQAVARDLLDVTQRAARLIHELAPDIVFAPPYEGGHPDHDSTALAVHVAMHLVARSTRVSPTLFEYASYHVQGNGLVFGEFLACDGVPYRQFLLEGSVRELKDRMLACHATQEQVWRAFDYRREGVRVAPSYDFTRPPGAPFHYDRVNWGTSGEQFLREARRALRHFEVQGPC